MSLPRPSKSTLVFLLLAVGMGMLVVFVKLNPQVFG
jgi:hypothetical protein